MYSSIVNQIKSENFQNSDDPWFNFLLINQNPTQVTSANPATKYQSAWNPHAAITWVPKNGAMILATEYDMV